MAQKRAREKESNVPSKRPKQGFSVGPANLPDGTYRRKAQRIKRGLIEKARIKKDYAKVKKRDLQRSTPRPVHTPEQIEADGSSAVAVPASLELHPDRAAMLSGDKADVQDLDEPMRGNGRPENHNRRGRDRMNPYTKQLEKAASMKAEAEQRREERTAAEFDRQRKREQRETWRRQMIKARQPGRDGKRKLGRESKILYEKVKNLVEAQGS